MSEEITGQTINKTEFVEAVQEITKGNKKDTTAAVTAVFKVIEDQLAKGNKVQIVGHGTYGTAGREEYTGRNPQTKEPMLVPAKRVPTFKAGKTLKEAVKLK